MAHIAVSSGEWHLATLTLTLGPSWAGILYICATGPQPYMEVSAILLTFGWCSHKVCGCQKDNTYQIG